MRNLFQTQRRLAHFRNAFAQRGRVLGANVRVQAESVLQFQNRLSRDPRSKNLVPSFECVMVALEPRDALLDRQPRIHRLFHAAQSAQRRQSSICWIWLHSGKKLNMYLRHYTTSTGHLGMAFRKVRPYAFAKMRLSSTTTIP